MQRSNFQKSVFQGTAFNILTAALIILIADVEVFLIRPVGGLWLALWTAWWVIIFTIRSIGTPVSSRFWTAETLLLLFAFVLGAPWEYTHFTGPIPRDNVSAWVGLVLFLAGILLQTLVLWCSCYGQQTPSGHLITNGPFHWVRFPGYLSDLLCILGISLTLSSLIALAAFGVSVWNIIERIALEEKVMQAVFKKEFDLYRKDVPWRLFPKIY